MRVRSQRHCRVRFTPHNNEIPHKSFRNPQWASEIQQATNYLLPDSLRKNKEIRSHGFFNETLVGGRKNQSIQIHDPIKPGKETNGSPIKRNKFYRFRMKVKTITFNAYDLDR
jgi:hypothetical protein